PLVGPHLPQLRAVYVAVARRLAQIAPLPRFERAQLLAVLRLQPAVLALLPAVECLHLPSLRAVRVAAERGRPGRAEVTLRRPAGRLRHRRTAAAEVRPRKVALRRRRDSWCVPRAGEARRAMLRRREARSGRRCARRREARACGCGETRPG